MHPQGYVCGKHISLRSTYPCDTIYIFKEVAIPTELIMALGGYYLLYDTYMFGLQKFGSVPNKISKLCNLILLQSYLNCNIRDQIKIFTKWP